MPVYEYGCHTCRKIVSLYVKRTEGFEPVCPDCGGNNLQRAISGFAFHLSEQSRIEQLDPRYDQMIDASNPDLSFDSLTKHYGLDGPVGGPKAKR